MLLADEQGLSPVRGLQDHVAIATKDVSSENAHLVVILDEQYRLGAAKAIGLRLRRHGRVGVAADLRELELEGRSVARLAVDPDVSPTLLDDAKDRREPEAGAFALLLRGEEGLEDPCLRFAAHPDAGVAHRDSHVRAREHSGVFHLVVVIHLDVRRLDGQLAAIGHGVARIDREVHQKLLDLSGVGLDAPELGRRKYRQLDVCAEHASEHLVHVGDALVQVQDLRLEHLLTAECEELPRQGRCAVARLADLFDVVEDRIIRV